MLCPECHGSSVVTYNQHSLKILRFLRLGTLGSQNGTYNFATRASVCSTQSAIHVPPISGRFTPEFVDLTLKERECRMHSTWFPKRRIKRAQHSTIALSRTLWIASPWPSNSFKRMATTDALQEPIACAFPDEWHQQLFMHHEMWSNLTAAMKPCFSDVCGYSCKDVQTSRLTVRSCSPLHCRCLTDTHRHQKKKSHILRLLD